MTQSPIIASPSTIGSLPGVSASMKVGGMALLAAKNGRLDIHLPDGRVLVFDHGIAGPHAIIEVNDFNFARRGLATGDIGFAEGYMEGEWSTPDLTRVLEFFAANMGTSGRYGRGKGLMLRAVNTLRSALFQQNTKSGARKNILAHYDLGNEFYSKWLDPSMTYSSALFEPNAESMVEAQALKYRRMAESVGANPDSHILEIGSGWGGFAELAAKEFGSKVTTITISKAQHEYAAKRIFDSGLAEKVQVELRDYRDVDGQYDGLVSIEMFEAVGEKFWPGYFAKIAQVLENGRKAALQIITIDDTLFDRYRTRVDFIQKYVFPGGMLPSPTVLKQQFQQAGMTVEGSNMFGTSYADTLQQWKRAFNDAWPEIEPMGFDLAFQRMWNFYLSYCEAGFRQGRIDVGHFVASRP